MRKSASVEVTVAETASCLLISLFLVFLRKNSLQIAERHQAQSFCFPTFPAVPHEPMQDLAHEIKQVYCAGLLGGLLE